MSPEAGAEHTDKPVIRDKRRIDPVTGVAREVAAEPAVAEQSAAAGTPGGSGDATAGGSGDLSAPTVEAALLDERTADLQRVQAEYANYRRRAERERLAAGDLAVGRVLTELLPILDDLDRAREHGDLTGGLKSIGEQLDLVLTKLGLEAFGEVGDPFDPNVHEAVLHNESPDVSEPTCTIVMRRGYRYGERLLRAAMVGVSDPAGETPADLDADAGS